MQNFTKENINTVINNFYNSKKEYKENIKKQKGINKITKRLPNFFTKSRFISPIPILLATLFGNYTLSLLFIGIFASTDLFDGMCARKFNAFSEYGRKLDAITDKIFALGIAFPFLFINPTLVISTIILEILIGIVNVNSELKSNRPHSTKLGKIKTFLTFTSLVSCYTMGNIKITNKMIETLLILANSVQIATLAQYICLDKKQSKTKLSDNKINSKLENNNSNDIIKSKELNKTKTITKEIQDYKNIKNTLLKETSYTEEIKDKTLTKTIR